MTELAQLKEAIATFAARIGEKLRSQNSLADSMAVFFHTNPFADEPQCQRNLSFRLPVPSAAGNELIHWTTLMAERIFREGFRYKKAGVLVTEIVSASARQQNLFYTPNTARDDKVAAVMDKVNRNFGRGVIQFAAEGIKPPWTTRFDRRSPRYTTRWDELLEILLR